MTVNTTETRKNAVEILKELNKDGIAIEYIVVNGQKIGILGAANDRDRENAMKAIQTALDSSNGNIYEMMSKLNTIAAIKENDIKPDEMVEINGEEIILSYEAKTAYTTDGEELVDCTDLPNMPDEAIKAVLIARAETILN
jgi:hypothetical protein